MDKLNKINLELEEYLGEYRGADEKIFDFGVRLGRLLEQRKMDDFRLQYFVEQSSAIELARDKQGLIDEIDKFALGMICFACCKHIEKYGSICFDADWRSRTDAKLEEEIVEEFGVQIQRTNQTQVRGDFEVIFSTTGKLDELFAKFKLPKEFSATLLNKTGEESCTLNDEDGVSESFTDASIGMRAHNKSLSIEHLKEIHKEFSQYYTVFVLKYFN